ncbi:hypothetical protein cypCar_00005325 [Cyprinus carpio]|nr:hypothetical protein cypCar_00005325 [Cyprinus carpio]
MYTDVSNMGVSVISRTGFEYRCYPFHTDIVLPFLPKPRAERALTQGKTAEDIHKVDKKFLACLINTTEQEASESSTNEGNLLVLLDQHAAHERVRLEGLVTS